MKKQSGQFQRFAAVTLSLLLLLGTLTGCGMLKSDTEVKIGIRQVLPDAVFLDVENGNRSENHKFKRFTIDNQGVVFTYENYQRTETFFGTTVSLSKNDYCERLFEYFSEEIGEIARKYAVEVEVISDSFVRIKNNILNMEDIENGVNAMQEIYILIEDYIPKMELSWFPFEISLFTYYGENQQIFIYKQGDWDASYYRQLLYMNFKSDVEMGLVTDVGWSQELLEPIPQKYIRNLYINGEPYQSNDYEICFLYNLKDGKYYTPVGFGVELDYNGGVEDYLQREIIEFYYPDAEYTISKKDKTSSYQIGVDHYLIKRRNDGLTFLKNGTELQITSKNEISGTHTGATYYYWISVDDFAMLLGMSVDKVEENGVYLLLPAR